MYLKGYKIKFDKDKELILPKWDYGGDKPFTNKAWNVILSKLRSLPSNSFPLFIFDLDNKNSEMIAIKHQKEFEDWMKNEFSKNK